MNRNLWLISKSILMLAICLTLIGAITVTAQAKLPIEQIPQQEHQLAGEIDGEIQAGGTISGTVTCFGFISEAANDVFVDLHLDVIPSEPEDTIHIACNQPYQFTGVLDGTYYIGAWLDENDSGNGPPNPGEPHEYFGAPDTIVISAGAPTHADIDIELYRYVERVSLFEGDDGLEEGAWDSEYPAISGDGRYVVFSSVEYPEYAEPINRGIHIFDRELDRSTLFYVDGYDDWFYEPDISADGNYVAAAYYHHPSEEDPIAKLLIKEWADEDSPIVYVIAPLETSEPYFNNPSISGDGCRVAFQFAYTIPGELDGTYTSNIYLHDCESEDPPTLISVATNGEDPGNDWSAYPAISDDGQFVVFKSEATDLVTQPPPIGEDLFEDLLYVRDIEAGTTELIPLPEGIMGGEFLKPSISADGHFVAYELEDDIFIYDRDKEQTIKIPKIDSEITEYSGDPSISGDGRYITYHAYRRADGGVWFSDIVVYDLDSGKFKIATRGFDGEIDSNSEYPVISADGRFVAFQSQVSDLVVDDTNGTRDVFVYMNELFGMEKNEIYLPMILK